MLDSVVALDIQRQGLGAKEPGNILRARGGSEGAGVLVDAVRVQVSRQGSEVEVVGPSVGTRSGNVVNVSEDRVEERSGVTELGQLEDEANNGNGFVCFIVSILHVNEKFILLDERKYKVDLGKDVQDWLELT